MITGIIIGGILMKKLKIFIIISLMMLFWVRPKSVSAKSFSSFQTKMVNGNSNYRIYQGMTHRGPVGSVGLARTFKYGNFQASAVKKWESRNIISFGLMGIKQVGLINELF